MPHRSSKLLLTGAVLVCALGVTSAAVAMYSTFYHAPEVVFTSPPTVSSASAVSRTTATNSSAASVATSKAAAVASAPPTSALIEMTFVPQAPFGNWDPPFDEACEESSIITVEHFLTGKPLDAQTMNDEVLAMAAWEANHGFDIDITVAQLSEVAEQYLNRSARILENPSIDDLKKELSQGNPVIVPLAGRDLGNPYYSGEGPWYHMLVLVGYDKSGFITHDVGTKRGENYHYDYDVLYDAIHDWTGVKEEIRSGKKVALVIH